MKIFQPIVTGSLTVTNDTTSSVIVKSLPTSSVVTNVVLYDSSSGQLYYTASNGIGGGSGVGVGFPFSGSAVITGSLLVSGSGITGSLEGTASYYNETDPVYTSQKPTLATTGSNTFRGDQTITGSLVLTGSSAIISGALYATNITYQNTSNVVSWDSTTKRFHYMAGADVVLFPYTGSAIMSASVPTNPVLTLIGDLAITGTIAFATSSATALRGIYIGNEASASFSPGYAIQFPSGSINAPITANTSFFEINDVVRPWIRLNTSTTDAYGAQIQFYRTRGSTAVQANQEIGELRFHSAYTNSPQTRYGRSAQILVIASSGSNDRSTPARMLFSTTPSGSVLPRVRLQIEDNGNVGIGAFSGSAVTASATLHISGANMIFDIPSKANGYILRSDANGGATWVSPASTAVFPYTGSAIISGSLTVTGSINGRGDITMASGTYTFRQTSNNTSSFTPNLYLHNTNGVLNTHNIITFQHGNDNGGDAVGLAQIGSKRIAGANDDSSTLWRGDLLFRVRNFGAFNMPLYIRYDGNVGISKTGSAINAKLDISGSTIITGSLNVTAGITGSLQGTSSFAFTASLAENIQGGNTNYISRWASPTTLTSSVIYQSDNQIGIGTTNPAYLTHIKNSTGQSVLKVEGTGSTNPLFLVEGSQGELFSVTDNISGSLFSVNDNSGLPIIDVQSDSTITMGNYAAPSLNTTTKIYTLNNPEILYRIETGSYDAAFVEYYYNSGSNYGSGYFISAWSGSDTRTFTDIRATNGGSTPTFTCVITGSYAELRAESSDLYYSIKAIIRTI